MSDAPKPPEPPSRPEIGGDTPDLPVAASVDAEPAGPPEDGAQPGSEAETPGPARRSRGGMVAIVLAVVLGALSVLCVGGLGVAFFLYRQVSEPDRSTPGVVVRQYLQATFDDRDKTRAAHFTCGRPTDIGDIEQLLADITSREERFHIHITVGWENFAADEGKTTATVAVRLKIEVPEEDGQSSESFQQWIFALRRQSDGWRVCSARPVS